MPILPSDRNLQSATEPLITDVDSGITAIHHTLGPAAFQASPGSHRHDGSDSNYVELKNLKGESISFEVAGGTTGTQPTFTGAPLFTGSYTRWGNMVHFSFHVDFDNITNFGTGQYYLTLPYPARVAYQFRDGCLHDISAGIDYHISGHVFAGSDVLQLFTTDRQGNRIYDFPFEQGEPITLSTADNFHVAGTYEIQQ
jgi:hypothetical protein